MGEDAFEHVEQSVKRGSVALVGAGPGDRGLLTLRGAELLRAADVVLYDQLVNPRLLDLAPTSAIRVFAGKALANACSRKKRSTLLSSTMLFQASEWSD